MKLMTLAIVMIALVCRVQPTSGPKAAAKSSSTQEAKPAQDAPQKHVPGPGGGVQQSRPTRAGTSSASKSISAQGQVTFQSASRQAPPSTPAADASAAAQAGSTRKSHQAKKILELARGNGAYHFGSGTGKSAPAHDVAACQPRSWAAKTSNPAAEGHQAVKHIPAQAAGASQSKSQAAQTVTPAAGASGTPSLTDAHRATKFQRPSQVAMGANSAEPASVVAAVDCERGASKSRSPPDLSTTPVADTAAVGQAENAHKAAKSADAPQAALESEVATSNQPDVAAEGVLGRETPDHADMPPSSAQRPRARDPKRARQAAGLKGGVRKLSKPANSVRVPQNMAEELGLRDKPPRACVAPPKSEQITAHEPHKRSGAKVQPPLPPARNNPSLQRKAQDVSEEDQAGGNVPSLIPQRRALTPNNTSDLSRANAQTRKRHSTALDSPRDAPEPCPGDRDLPAAKSSSGHGPPPSNPVKAGLSGRPGVAHMQQTKVDRQPPHTQPPAKDKSPGIAKGQLAPQSQLPRVGFAEEKAPSLAEAQMPPPVRASKVLPNKTSAEESWGASHGHAHGPTASDPRHGIIKAPQSHVSPSPSEPVQSCALQGSSKASSAPKAHVSPPLLAPVQSCALQGSDKASPAPKAHVKAPALGPGHSPVGPVQASFGSPDSKSPLPSALKRMSAADTNDLVKSLADDLNPSMSGLHCENSPVKLRKPSATQEEAHRPVHDVIAHLDQKVDLSNREPKTSKQPEDEAGTVGAGGKKEEKEVQPRSACEPLVGKAGAPSKLCSGRSSKKSATGSDGVKYQLWQPESSSADGNEPGDKPPAQNGTEKSSKGPVNEHGPAKSAFQPASSGLPDLSAGASKKTPVAAEGAAPMDSNACAPMLLPGMPAGPCESEAAASGGASARVPAKGHPACASLDLFSISTDLGKRDADGAEGVALERNNVPSDAAGLLNYGLRMAVSAGGVKCAQPAPKMVSRPRQRKGCAPVR